MGEWTEARVRYLKCRGRGVCVRCHGASAAAGRAHCQRCLGRVRARDDRSRTAHRDAYNTRQRVANAKWRAKQRAA